MIYASDLPIGARFKLGKAGPTWVLVDDRGAGLMVRWAGFDDSIKNPLFCSVAESRDKFLKLPVFDVE